MIHYQKMEYILIGVKTPPCLSFLCFFKRTEQCRVLRDCLLDHINNKVSVFGGYYYFYSVVRSTLE